MLTVLLAAAATLAIAAIACNDDGSSPPPPSPVGSPGVTPIVTPGSGVSPVQAVGTYMSANGLDGVALDLDPTHQAVCPLEDVTETPVAEGTPINVSRLFLGQFCLTLRDFIAEESATIIVELPDTNTVWEMALEFDSDSGLWKVKNVDKTSE